MSYYLVRALDLSFEDAVRATIAALKVEGFGVLTDIDVQATLREKLGTEFRKYRILGACNPPFAHRALLEEDKIGLLLPCNVIVQETIAGKTEIAAIDPVAAMKVVESRGLGEIATEVRDRLQRAVDAVG